MLAALVAIPFIGTQRTFLAFAVALGLVAAAGLGWRYLALPAVLAGVIAIPIGTVKATDGERVLFEGESEEQYIRVIEEDDGDRLLELNEGQAVHSMYRPGSYLTEDVWDGYLVLPFAGLSDPRSGSRSSATPPGPPPGPTATTSRRPRWTGWRSTPS